MTYLLTNASALTALQSLTMTQQSLANTQSQLSTGLSIQHASDNTSYWSISQTMSSDNGALGAVSSALKQSSSMLATFTSAIEQTISVVNNIKNDLVAAQNPGANLTQIQSDIAAQQNSLLQIAGGSAFNGQNWLNGTVNGSTAGFQSSVNLVGAYTNSGGVSYISVTASAASLYTNGSAATSVASASGGILGATSAGYSSAILGGQAINVTGATGANVSNLTNMVASVNNTITQLETAAATIGSAQEQLTTQQTFISAMQTNLTNGVASLVDADMNQVSTRLQALQTQQQLGVQSLSIANQSSQMILKLFQ
ncbi:flagellin [Rhodoblastus acidophilus]|uniref:Flagellin n=1 Tax=Candidatus Rhodoblastus alkanivorans TaxID=2954117 RepID=A0ABS9Z3L4_9HYPH|nr:flagellin [Candidatus Rhodoblastus alkanivorans]MCI4678830.1 flagellin [Candidatus Rhodoblastus alkanivorans]MCI4682219.1 flagellin [Candidatus Rhodoblastus alkanivorans]MDI4639521.1 flagellin [Rhodoblastus acidophilus]